MNHLGLTNEEEGLFGTVSTPDGQSKSRELAYLSAKDSIDILTDQKNWK
jgi:hypothetical protein